MSRLIRAQGGELASPTPPIRKQRRDYTARELHEMAGRAAAGDAPPGSPADLEIRRAELAGDFERAGALRKEVRELAPDLARLARAKERADKKEKKRKPRGRVIDK